MESKEGEMHDILEGSWAYQEMVQKGWIQGREEGHQQGVFWQCSKQLSIW